MTVAELLGRHAALRSTILERLEEFRLLPADSWFYEVCFCILTPQSKAVHADAAVRELQRMQFQETGADPVGVLRHPDRYIRFHNVKAGRLQYLRVVWPQVNELLQHAHQRQGASARDVRDQLVQLVPGIGYKEASHALRNMGWRGLSILDRHILRCLCDCGVFTEIPNVSTRKSYLEVERQFIEYAARIHVDPDELDLLFWSLLTGFVLK